MPASRGLRLEVRTTHLLLESLASVRDITLTGIEEHFQNSFSSAGERPPPLRVALCSAAHHSLSVD